jgi:hypothetical protein
VSGADGIEQLFGSRLATMSPEVIDAAGAAAVREQLHFTRYTLLDRGSYDIAAFAPGETTRFAPLVALAEQRTGRSFAIAEARALRLLAGDYLLAHHDRIHDDHPIELILDLSPASVPGAEVHYRRRGQVYFRVPCVPGALSLVERGPTVTCNHTYVSRLHPAACVVRVVLLLRDRVTATGGA